jgi:hypothetical protein
MGNGLEGSPKTFSINLISGFGKIWVVAGRGEGRVLAVLVGAVVE